MNSLTHSGLKIKQIGKKFNGRDILKDVTFNISPGEVHGLVGENGAGKSTLLKILAGAYQADQGEVWLDDIPLNSKTPVDAIAKGISIIYQELSLIPELTVVENIFLGREINKYGVINSSFMLQEGERLLEELDIQIDLNQKISTLNVAQCQMIEIAKGVSTKSKVIIMDEPSDTLNAEEVEKLFSIIRRLKSSGQSILYVSHRLHEIFQICDRVTVLRDGNYINTWNTKEIEESDLVKSMAGRNLEISSRNQYKKSSEEVVLRLTNVKTSSLKSVNLQLKKGEILGIGGLTGSGRSALGRVIYGIDPLIEGEIILNGEVINKPTPVKMIHKKIGFLPEDRKRDGLIMSMNLRENLSIVNLKKIMRFGFISSFKEEIQSTKYWKDLKIKSPTLNTLVQHFSGGNQQKVLIGRWLWFGCDILIFDEPTRGIDVATRNEIYRILREISEEGMSIMIISSEYKELLEVSDRILIMSHGQISGEMDVEKEDSFSYMNLALNKDGVSYSIA